MKVWLGLIAGMVSILPTAVQLLRPGSMGSEVAVAVNAVLDLAPQHNAFIIIITEKASVIHGVSEFRAPWGMGILEVPFGGNVTQSQISRIIVQGNRLRRVSWSVTVVVVSDDPAFLATFTEWSLKGRLLVWSTRLLVLTRLPLHRLHHLRNTLAITNSMLIILAQSPSTRHTVHVFLPFQANDTEPLMIADITGDEGKIRARNVPLFPDKFKTLSTGPQLLVTRIRTNFKTKTVRDPEAPGKERILTWDPDVKCLETTAESMNFSFVFIPPPDKTYGVKLPDGSWTGMIRMIQEGEVDMGIGLFSITPLRAEVVDFTYPVTFETSRVIVARGSPEIDPWGFLLPLTPLSWVAVLTALVVVIAVLMVLPFCLPDETLSKTRLTLNAASCVRVILHQDVLLVTKWWWWERMVVGVWMLMTLVLTQSYAGNLMSLLAVRYIKLPIQALQDIVDNPVSLLLMEGTAQWQAFMDAESGVMRDVAGLESVGRLKGYRGRSKRVGHLDTLVRRGDHVEVMEDTSSKTFIANDFSKIGKCEFYLAREKFLPMMSAMAGPQDGPLVPAISSRILRISEAGLYSYWLALFTPNFSSCLNPPNTVVVKSSLGITNLWGTLVILAGGVMASLVIFTLEYLSSRVLLPGGID